MEVIVALVILSTALLAVFGALRASAGGARHARMLTRSVLLAETLLAEAALAEEKAFGTKEGQQDLYHWKVQIAPTPVENLAAIHVEVIWQEQQRQQQYELVSFVHLRPGS